MGKALSYCGETVRAHDPDRFLLSLFVPPERREALWALFAFNHEIAKTREVVSETQLGLIRLQWWREALGRIHDGAKPPEHEILKPLAAAIAAHDLPRDLFETLLYAREFDLEDVQPANKEGLLNYADFTSTPLMKLAVQVTGDDPLLQPVAPVAVGYALAGLLRAVPFHAANHRCYLPEDLMRAQDLSAGKIYNLKAGDLDARRKISSVAENLAEEIISGIRPGNRFLRAAQALALIYKRQMKGLGYDVFHPGMRKPPAFKELRLALGVLLA